MEKTTNINIQNHDHTFSYLLGYEPIYDINYDGTTFPIKIKKDTSSIFLLGPSSNSIRFNNNWTKEEISDTYNTLDIPSIYKLSNINLYFPQFSVNTYDRSDFALDIYTYIGNMKIILGNYIISPIDLIATTKKDINGNIYCEFMRFEILDPYYMIYSDDWKNFRKTYCNENDVNNKLCNIHFSLYPVSKNHDNTYTTIKGYIGGQNTINICNHEHMGINIMCDFLNHDTVTIDGVIKYNSNFNNIFDYVIKTYNIKGDEDIININPGEIMDVALAEKWKDIITYDLAIYDKNDIYLKTKTPISIIKDNIIHEEFEFNKNDIFFDNWMGYHEGMFIICFLNIINGDHEIAIASNKIPLTSELFKYFVGDNSLNSINIDIIDKMSYNINIANKIVNNIIQVDNIKNSKSNIIQPVFFRSYNLNNLILHPEVVENICINLDIYKSKVDTFILKIGDNLFIESGRTTAGVIFKILGSKLNAEKTSGVYFILNEKRDTITSGKYKYEF